MWSIVKVLGKPYLLINARSVKSFVLDRPILFVLVKLNCKRAFHPDPFRRPNAALIRPSSRHYSPSPQSIEQIEGGRYSNFRACTGRLCIELRVFFGQMVG